MPTDPYAVLRALLRADAARNTPKKREVWKDVANDLLGKGESDASAIRQANAVIARIGK